MLFSVSPLSSITDEILWIYFQMTGWGEYRKEQKDPQASIKELKITFLFHPNNAYSRMAQ